ncbi:ADP-ribose diphosphatase [Malassezia furfur]|uniref:ADP-ribose diphosphatase n=1 Tax=Malassezia furfur TaxID=55194 RepID=A0ABY8ERJ6_MALFU|nr:ADP-ribose diphosphatase [Malassezia furfur]
MKLCTVEIELAENAPEPVAHPDEGEYIERHLLPLPTLYEELQQFRTKNYAVDARLEHLATGFKLGMDYAAK